MGKRPDQTFALLKEAWWPIVFCVVCIALYFQAASDRNTAIAEIKYRVQEMEKEKLIASQERSELALRLQSEADPAWIEMILMKELGVVPEGWIKVHFTR